MSQELLYTSAPQGLKPGSRGFCTVVSTPDLSRNLAERLESFSGYRHAFMAHEAGADQNPVNYAHYHTTLGGRKYHILSRVADAGLDYTQRSNKLAHHVALEPAEAAAAPGGPAWVMAAPGFLVEQWDGQVRNWPAGRKPTSSPATPQVCQTWKQLTGDAGWGGVLAESGLRKGGLMSVIFPAGTPTLQLVVEALNLLPPEKRWEVTFSTYFTKAPAGVDCQWRFVLDGTPEAAALRRDVRAAVIDLAKPLGQALAGELVQAARTGVVTHRAETRPAAPLQRQVAEPVRPVPPVAAAVPPQVEESWEFNLAAPPALPRPAEVAAPPAAKEAPPAAWQRRGQRANRRWILIAVGSTLALVFLMAVAGVVVVGGRRALDLARNLPGPRPPVANLPQQDQNRSQPERAEPPSAAADAATSAAGGEEADQGFQAAGPVTVQTPSTDPSTQQASPPDTPAVPKASQPTPPPPPPDPFGELGTVLKLPPRMVRHGEGATAPLELNNAPAELGRIKLQAGARCELKLLGKEFEGEGNTIIASEEEGLFRWQIVSQPSTATSGTQTSEVASFDLQDDGRFLFKWQTEQPPIRLHFCRLQLTASGATRTCTFEITVQERPRTPVTADDPNLSGRRIQIFETRDFWLRPDDPLYLDVHFRGVKPGKTITLNLQDRNTSATLSLSDVLDRTADAKLTPSESLDAIESRVTVTDKPLVKEGDSWVPQIQIVELSMSKIGEHGKTQAEILKGARVDLQKRSKVQWRDWAKLQPNEQRDVIDFQKLDNKYSPLEKKRDKTEQDNAEMRDLRKQMELFPTEIQNKARAFDLKNTDFLQAVQRDYDLAKAIGDLDTWSTSMKQFRVTLHNDACLEYRLYLKTDGQEIELAKTNGFGVR